VNYTKTYIINQFKVVRIKKAIHQLIVLLCFLFFLSSCVDTANPTSSGTGTGGNTNDSRVTLDIFYPLSGDTIRMGPNFVQFSAQDRIGGPGLAGANLFVNATLIQTIPAQDGIIPAIVIHTDSLEKKLGWDPASIPKEIYYAISVYNSNAGPSDGEDSPNVAFSETIDSVYIDRRPEAPQNLGILRISDKSFNLYWEDVSSNETKFQLWRKDGENRDFILVRDEIPANNTAINDFVTSEFITYFYQVRAVNGYGNSDFSNTVNSKGVEGGGQPTNLFAEALGATKVKLSWTDNSSDEFGFIIERTNFSGEWEELNRVIANIEEYIDNSVLPATPYSYRVASFTSSSISAWSNIASVTTFTEDVPPPLNLTADFIFEENAVLIEWIDNTNQELSTIIERKEGLAGDYEILHNTGLPDITSFTDSNITTNTLYTYRARYSTASGFNTDYSNEDTAFVPILPPNAPTNLRISEFAPNLIYGLLWDDNSNDEDGFEIERIESITGAIKRIILSENVKAYNDTLTDPTKTYTYRVRSFAGNRFSAYSNEVGTSSGTGNLASPTNFQAFQVLGSTNVQIIWDYAGSNPLGFVIERISAAEIEYQEITRVAPDARFYLDDSGLIVGLSYIYRIKAYDATDESPYTELNPPIVIQNP
jgi:hypothetical protein